MNITGQIDKCVICGDVSSHECSMIKTFSRFSVSEKDKACLTLQRQLSVIFLLRKMLRIPEARLEVLLVKYGDPSNWKLNICSPCNRVFVEATFVHERILKLHQEFEDLSLKLRKHARDNRESTLNVLPSTSISHGPRKRRKRGRPKANRITADFKSNPSDDVGLSEFVRNVNGTGKVSSVSEKAASQTATPERQRKVRFKIPIVKIEPIDSMCENNDADCSTYEEVSDSPPSVFDVEPNSDNDDDPGDPDFIDDLVPIPPIEIESSTDKKPEPASSDRNEKNDDTSKAENEFINNFTAPQPIKVELGYKCPLCPRTALSKCSSHGHILRVHYNQEKPFYCHLCPSRWKIETTLRQHLEDEHNCTTTPLDDPEEVQNVKAAQIHQQTAKTETGSRTYKCDLCRSKRHRFLFKSLETLEAHKKVVHLGMKDPYCCKLCGKSFTTNIMLRRHFYVHQRHEREKKVASRKKPFCDDCNINFKSMSAFNSHLKTKQHAGGNEYPYQCELCIKGFFQMPSLENHRRQEHFEQLNIEPFKCSYCSQLLSGQRALDHHIRIIHTKDTLYRCEPCNLGFMFVNVYNKHMAIVHAKDKAHLCSYCPKRFSQKSHLETHIRVHTGEKPYKCPHPNCDKEYADRPTFRRHVESHGEQIYECSVCENRQFKIWHTYRLHMKKHNQKVHKKPVHRLFHEPSSTSTSTTATDSQDNIIPHNHGSKEEEATVEIANHLESNSQESTSASFTKNQIDPIKIDTEIENMLAI